MGENITLEELTQDERDFYDETRFILDMIENPDALDETPSTSPYKTPTHSFTGLSSPETHTFLQDGPLDYLRIFLTPTEPNKNE